MPKSKVHFQIELKLGCIWTEFEFHFGNIILVQLRSNKYILRFLKSSIKVNLKGSIKVSLRIHQGSIKVPSGFY